jgi:serine/threonine protein kinase
MWQVVEELTSCCWLEECDQTHYKRIKKILPLKRGVEEVKVLKTLNGIQGTPSLLSYHVEENHIVFYMSYFEGKALDVVSLETKQAMEVFGRGLKILSHIHARGIWHRDLCPRHILIDGDNNIMIIDFGAATPRQAKDEISGTLAFAAPEVVFNPKQFSDSSDLFAYAKSFYIRLTSELAVKRPEVLDLFLRGMVLDPEKRFPSALVYMQYFHKCDSWYNNVKDI